MTTVQVLQELRKKIKGWRPYKRMAGGNVDFINGKEFMREFVLSEIDSMLERLKEASEK